MHTLIHYAERNSPDLFESDLVMMKLSRLGNRLERLNDAVRFEMFRPKLEEALFRTERASNAGRRPLDCVFMFKVLVVQRAYNLSDEQCEYDITDRASFKSFLGISTVKDVPDAKTIWLYRERLKEEGLYDELFGMFARLLDDEGYREDKENGVRIIDSTFVEFRRQRNTHEENKTIKDGRGDELWNDEPDKRRQKDVFARWAKKREERHYGCKMHICVDAEWKIIRKVHTTTASVVDCKVVAPLLDPSDGGFVFADSGYQGAQHVVEELGAVPVFCEKGQRNHPLTEMQIARNNLISTVRVRVEHPFAFLQESMGGKRIRTIGGERAAANNTFAALIYNMFRYEQLVRMRRGQE